MFLCSGRAIGDPERAIAVRYRAPARLAPARLIQPFDHDMILELNVPDPGEVEDLQRAVLHSDQSLRTCRPRTADRGSSVEVPAGTPQRDGSSWAQCSRPSPPTTVRKGRPAGVHWAGRRALTGALCSYYQHGQGCGQEQRQATRTFGWGGPVLLIACAAVLAAVHV